MYGSIIFLFYETDCTTYTEKFTLDCEFYGPISSDFASSVKRHPMVICQNDKTSVFKSSPFHPTLKQTSI